MIRSPTTNDQAVDPQTAVREITYRCLRHLAFRPRTPQKRGLDRFELNHRLCDNREWIVANAEVAFRAARGDCHESDVVRVHRDTDETVASPERSLRLSAGTV